MVDKQIATILNSGNISTIYIGGATAPYKAVVFGDLSAANVSFDNAATSLAAATVQAALVELANVGLAHMTLATPYTGGQTIGTSAVKLSAFDTIHHNINGAVTPVVDTSEAVAAHTYTIDKTGLYGVYGTITAEFSSSAAVALRLYKNSAPFGPPVELQGRGAGKPVLFSYNDLADLTATDVLEVYAVSDTASTSVLITASSMIVERKPLA